MERRRRRKVAGVVPAGSCGDVLMERVARLAGRTLPVAMPLDAERMAQARRAGEILLQARVEALLAQGRPRSWFTRRGLGRFLPEPALPVARPVQVRARTKSARARRA